MPDIVSLIVTVLSWVLAIVAVVGLVDAARRPAAAFTFVGKLPKLAWLAILALSAVLIWWSPISIFGIAGIVAVGVYFADVRRKISELR